MTYREIQLKAVAVRPSLSIASIAIAAIGGRAATADGGPDEVVPLHRAVAAGLAQARVSGTGASSGDALVPGVRRSRSRPVHVVVPPGTIFRSERPSVQGMQRNFGRPRA